MVSSAIWEKHVRVSFTYVKNYILVGICVSQSDTFVTKFCTVVTDFCTPVWD